MVVTTFPTGFDSVAGDGDDCGCVGVGGGVGVGVGVDVGLTLDSRDPVFTSWGVSVVFSGAGSVRSVALDGPVMVGVPVVEDCTIDGMSGGGKTRPGGISRVTSSPSTTSCRSSREFVFTAVEAAVVK